MGIERRRAPRVVASLELRIAGLERRSSMRQGDLSVTGLRVTGLGVDVGQPGDRHRLALASRDGVHVLEVDAQVVRVVRATDIEAGSYVSDAAFEFLPRDEFERESLVMLFVHVARDQIRYDASGVRPAQDREGSVRSMVLETEWALRRGEAIVVEVPLPAGGSARLTGRAVRSRASTKGSYRTVVEFSTDATQLPARKVSGDLSQVRASSMLALAAMERIEGILQLSRDGREVILYLRDGQLIDIEAEATSMTRQELIAEVSQWDKGSFEMSVCKVERPDKLGMPTPMLLLELARSEQRKQVA